MYKSPMLLEKRDQPLQDNNYITELKYDGIRFLYSTMNGRHGYTRHETSCLDRFPELIDISLPDGCILDGELIVTDENGHPNFEGAMTRFQGKKGSSPVQYMVFDVLYHKGEDVTSLPLLERKKLLEEITTNDEHISFVPYIEGNALTLFETVTELNLEGIVQKKADSRYTIGKRSNDWIKVVNYQFHEVILTGIKKKETGYILSFPNGKYAGTIQFPLPPKQRKALWSVIDSVKDGEDDNSIYLKPLIRIEVKGRGIARTGTLRLPVFHQFLFDSR